MDHNRGHGARSGRVARQRTGTWLALVAYLLLSLGQGIAGAGDGFETVHVPVRVSLATKLHDQAQKSLRLHVFCERLDPSTGEWVVASASRQWDIEQSQLQAVAPFETELALDQPGEYRFAARLSSLIAGQRVRREPIAGTDSVTRRIEGEAAGPNVVRLTLAPARIAHVRVRLTGPNREEYRQSKFRIVDSHDPDGFWRAGVLAAEVSEAMRFPPGTYTITVMPTSRQAPRLVATGRAVKAGPCTIDVDTTRVGVSVGVKGMQPGDETGWGCLLFAGADATRERHLTGSGIRQFKVPATDLPMPAIMRVFAPEGGPRNPVMLTWTDWLTTDDLTFVDESPDTSDWTRFTIDIRDRREGMRRKREPRAVWLIDRSNPRRFVGFYDTPRPFADHATGRVVGVRAMGMVRPGEYEPVVQFTAFRLCVLPPIRIAEGKPQQNFDLAVTSEARQLTLAKLLAQWKQAMAETR